jgi:hypothetical protein
MVEGTFWTQRILGAVSFASSPEPRYAGAAPAEPDACVLLEKGTPLFDPRCSACGRQFEPPHRLGERFGAAFLFLEPVGESENSDTERRLLIGSKVRIATTSCRLAPALDRHQIIVGARVLVGTPLAEEGGTLLVLFCEACGQNIARRANGAGRVDYQWDSLAAFEPHLPTTRWKWRRLRQPAREAAPGASGATDATMDAGAEARAKLLNDGRTRAYFLARDLLLEGVLRQREMRIRALRAEAPFKMLDQAFEQLGATYGRDGDGEVLMFPPIAMQSFRCPSRLDSIPADAAADAPRPASIRR